MLSQLLNNIKILELTIKIEHQKIKLKTDQLAYLRQHNQNIQDDYKKFNAIQNKQINSNHQSHKNTSTSFPKASRIKAQIKQQNQNFIQLQKLQSQYHSINLHTDIIKNLEENQKKQLQLLNEQIDKYSSLFAKSQKLKAMRNYINEDCRLPNKNKNINSNELSKQKQMVMAGMTKRMRKLLK